MIFSKKIFAKFNRNDENNEFQHSSHFFDQNEKNVLFMDNQFLNSIDQVLRYFDSGFLTPEKIRIVFKSYNGKNKYIIDYCNSLNIEWYSYVRNADIPEISNCLVFYPFNSSKNVRMINNRNCAHILLLHGESNKIGSIKPLTRVYDTILVAGSIAIDRLTENRIFESRQISNHKVIKLGDTVLGSFDNIIPGDKFGEALIGYFPTWEGGNEKENLTSLDKIYPEIFNRQSLCNSSHIAIRFHPHTGVRRPSYKKHAKDLIVKLIKNDFKITYMLMGLPTLLEEELKHQFPCINWHKQKTLKPIKIGMAFVDNAAMEAVMDTKKILNYVLLDYSKENAAPENYWKLKSGYQIDMLNIKADWKVYKSRSSNLKKYYKKLIEYEHPELVAMSNENRFDWLDKLIRNSHF